MRLIDADALIKKAHDEAKGMAEPYDDFGTLVEWLADKIPTIDPYWNEMLVLCDCCGHAIRVKRL